MAKQKRKDTICYFKMKRDTAQKLDTRIRSTDTLLEKHQTTHHKPPRQNPSIEEQPHYKTQNRGDTTLNT